MALLIDGINFQIKKIGNKEYTGGSVLKESISPDGKIRLTGIIQRAEAPNQNKRIYPKPILEKEVVRYIKEEISQKRAFGELDHPDSTVINYRNVSHVILELWWEGNDLWGTLELLDTPSGNIAKAIILAGYTIGISSRGLGSAKQLAENITEVQDDFLLIGWDLVTNPSTHNAFVELSESVINETNKEREISLLMSDIICELSGVCCINK